MPTAIPPPPPRTPLTLAQIKYAIYGRLPVPGGLKFGHILEAGWDLKPSIVIAARDINKLGLDIQNWREALEESVLEVMMPSIAKNFMMEGRPVEWEPLALYTQKIRGSARPILYRTGSLERAATSFSIWTFSDTGATIKGLPAHVWYGAVHQEGYGSIWQKATKLAGKGADRVDIMNLANQIFRQAGSAPGKYAKRESQIVIPQREFVLFQDDDIEDIQMIFANWMEDLADRVGRGWRTSR